MHYYLISFILLIAPCYTLQDSTGFIPATFHSCESGKFSKLEIKVDGIQELNGQILVALYNSPSTFNQPGKEFKHTIVKVKSGTVTVSFDSLSAGVYAVGVYHDANENYVLDDNWLGMPTEGFGFSNNAMGAFGPPSWSQASFSIGSGTFTTLFISLRHF